MKRTMKFATAVMCFGLAFASVQSVELAPAQAQSASSLQGKLGQISKQVDDLEKRYVKPSLLKTEFSAETRFNDAKVAYVLKQYGKSSVLFLDVITRTKANNFVGYREALYLLSDGLFRSRNHVGAKTFLNQLVALGSGKYYQEALQLLLEISFTMNDYKDIQDVYAKLEQQGNLTNATKYLRGKTRYKQGQFKEAMQDFDAAASDAKLYYVATYYSAVCNVSLKQFDAAMNKYKSIVKTKPKTPRDLDVFYLSYMAMGRLAYEQGKYDESLLHYNKLPRTNKHFITAMYEATWALVQKKSYKSAKQNIEVLLYNDPNPQLYTRAMLLRADLSLRIKDYKTAQSAFEDVLERYDPIKQQMDEFAKQHQDLQGFFASLVDDNLVMATPPGLPVIKTQFAKEAPEQWLNRGRLIGKANILAKDVLLARREVRDSSKMLDEIDARLNSDTRVKSFPMISTGLGVALALDSQLIELRRDILQREHALLKGSMRPDEAQLWSKLQGDLNALGTAYKKIPTSEKGLDAREKKVARDFAALRKKVDKLSYEINNMKAEANAIDVYLQTQSLLLSKEAKAKVDGERALLKQELAALEKQRTQMRKLLDVARQEVGYGSVLSPMEYATRDAYRKKLGELSNVLGAVRGRVANGELGQLASVRSGIAPQEARLAGYRKKLNETVQTRVGELKKQVANERTLLQTHKASLGQLTGSTRDAVASIAYHNFLLKKEEFTKIVLRADVGKIDVLYQGKDDATREINKLFQQRTNELKSLQEAFEDVR